ncbi:MAG TPA: hypothetical protein VN026_05730 [Bacteroidia bacterium]|jgi:hypothetical protein|nr:hypothetical protein [Bacteroidia bacterium]
MKTYKLIRSEQEISSFESLLCNLTGVIVSCLLIGFFLIMKVFGWYQILELRYFNFLILFAGIHSAFLSYRNKVSPEGINYLKGLKMGLRITLTAVIPFAIFMGIYLKIDTNFMNYIIQHGDFGRYLTPGRAAGVVGFEGFVSGAIMTYIIMPYFKNN